MDAILIKNGNAYSLKINGEYVAFVNEDFIGYATQEFRDNLIGILSLKNCQAIELGYDLDELAEKHYGVHVKQGHTEEDSLQRKIDFILGFVSALEILGDKKFSEEDMKLSYKANEDGWVSFQYFMEDFPIQTEWDVEIVEEDSKVVESHVWDGSNDGELTWKKQPLFDVDGCLILKRK
jgi:hypothetical protein